MKKILAIVMALSMFVMALTGCKAGSNKGDDTSSKVASTPLMTGLAVISSIAKSKDAGAEAGLAQSDSTVVAVTVDANRRIVRCAIDAVQAKVNFDATGKITTSLNTMFRTKNELGANYGMGGASGIKKEWNEQAAAFAAYVEGKTVDEVKGIAVNEDGTPIYDDLKTSVTISIGGFVAAVEKAVVNAKDIGAIAGDKLGIGVVTNIAKSKDAGTEDGLVQVYSTYTVSTFDAQGKITSCIIDASQNNVNFTKVGKITTNLTAELKTKDELGDAYGMKKASSIGKEWYQQADAFAAYVVGKTAEEANNISINDASEPTDADLKASVTISIGDFMTVIEKASVYAK